MTDKNIIIPSQIPWESIKGKELEELLYWLLDSMGAKNLEWRIGGIGDGAADQGRDIECSFYLASPNGELIPQTWWVEAKGRTKTVEKSEVQSAVLNVAGNPNIDTLIIATNTNFSNPTRDWVKEHSNIHRQPSVQLWEKTELENYCSKHPQAVIRLFSKALSHQGKLEVVRTRFWNYASLTDEPTLELLWEFKEDLDIEADALLALIISELANGNINKRSWGMYVDEALTLTTLLNSLVNCFVLISRADDNGVKQDPYINSIAYLILCCLDMFGSEKITSILQDFSQFDDREWPLEVQHYILSPVLNVLVGDIRDVCMNDCSRLLGNPYQLSENEIENYWRRLKVSTSSNEDTEKFLSIESHDEPCKVGFSLNKENGCPLNNNATPEARLSNTLAELEKAIHFRKSD